MNEISRFPHSGPTNAAMDSPNTCLNLLIIIYANKLKMFFAFPYRRFNQI
jgi:hypothetical protein